MPRLLLTLTSYPPAVGGAQIHSSILAQHLDRLTGFEVEVATQWSRDRRDWLFGTTINAPSDSHDYTVGGIQVHRLGLSPRERYRLLPHGLLYYPLQSWALDGISDLLAEKLRRHADDVDLIENVRIGREGLSYASWKLARRLAVPFVFRPLHHPRWGGFLHRHYQELYRRADGLVALTSWEREKLIQLGVASERICVTGIGPVLADSWNGERFREVHQLGLSPIVLFLGQKYPYKGLQALLGAMPTIWSHHSSCRLVAIGPRTAHSRELLRGMNDPRILEFGSVDLQDKSDALAACDLLCVPSSQESFGGVYTEAWAMGKPVIGGPAPAVREVIESGEDGLVVAQHPEGIAEAIIALLSDPERAAAMGERGRRKVERFFTWDRIAQTVSEFYTRLLKG